ncbi:RUN and SH3 domain-containing protein 1 isoform X5 [Denticeps clupeoides]|uniref:RUN and SH3 domain-containing protein 1 isoform X5 n=1 Tax=Denticeps clupeoides TaxID=299321 RepID=UPI0010A309E8|nr:RUN and SH3 domain-containing protein 1 isoform X5 [Denticeps clupeoides]
MHSSSRNSVPPRPRRRVEAKPQGHVTKREDKNMNGTLNTVSSSPGRGSRGPPESSRLRAGAQAGRKPVAQPALMRQQQHQGQLVAAKAKPRAGNAVSNLPPPVVDPNCNEPRLPCLCCDGHSPQDSNSLFNHNHNNNNTIAMRHHLGLQAPHGRDEEKVEKEAEEAKEAEQSPDEAQEENIISAASQDKEKAEESPITDDKEKSDEDECDTDIDASEEVDVNGNAEEQQDADDDDDDEDDDDTLVPSCCDCPASMLEFSLSSSTSSSSTSISSCSDFELDCMDTFSLQKQEEPAGYPPRNSTVTQPCTLPLDASMEHISSPCSPDEGYPSAPSSPCSDFTESNGKPGLIGTKMKFLDSIDDIRFYRVVQMAQWDLADEMGLRDRLDHLYRLENVNKQLKMTYLAKLQEGMGFEEEDLSGVLDEMGNTEIPWKLYKGDSQCYSQEFSDAGVDLTAPSDLDEPAADSLAPSPLEPPPRPPKPTTRHIISQPETHTYINISGNSPVMSSTTPPSFSTFSPLPSAKASKKSIPDPPALPPPPSQTVPYFTLYTASPTLASPTPPIPPPRRRHKARLEAQRCAQLQADKSPMSLPPPTSKPPPLPPPPALPSPPKIPPPPSLPPPPSFHALDVEIRKLLALAGLTQAELLKLSPELGVCVSGILVDEDDVTIPEPSRMSQVQEKKVKDNRMQTGDEKGKGTVEMDGWTEKIGGTQGPKAIDVEAHVVEDREANGDTLKTTSFTEMARRRKRNGGSTNSSCSCSSYYSTTNSSASSLESFDHASVLSDTPPPPPPRPLPPCPRVLPEPPELPPLKSCTLPANASRPERFDWLIAFTPDTETPPLEKRKVAGEGTFLKATLGSRVTTFKELRYKSKQSSPPAPSEPEPDPAVITPDPDILYNLKWRKEKSDGDGSQWEYTSQAQASFFRPPPPTPASLALFREMRHLNIEGGGQLETNSSPKIGCSVSEGNLLTMNVEREADGHYRKSEEKASQVRGRADGGRTWESRTAVRSLSFTDSLQRGGFWMGEDARAPLRGQGLSSLCLQEKRALVSAVSVAVEAILSQFNSSRTLVQKSLLALSGDSSVNPSLGRLVLQCLCPALRNLLSDGLKPHQSDLIAGRRPNSPWGLVQASTKTGPSTQALHALQCRVAELPQLKQSRHRFNAFLLGLLNIKLLDYWISHLQTCSDLLETYYRPNSFMLLSLTACQPLFEELLLLLQPLSLLTFNLDLLFQHHHLDPASPAVSPAYQSPPSQDLRFRSSSLAPPPGRRLEKVPEQSVAAAASRNLQPGSRGPVTVTACVSKRETSPQLQWLQEKEIAPPEDEAGNRLSQQAGQVIQEGWGAVLRWGERLGQNLGALRSAGEGACEDAKRGSPSDRCSTQDLIRPSKDESQWDRSAALPWGLGRLFGASKSPTDPPAHTPPTRRPSHWLAPSVSVLTRMVSNTKSNLPDKITLESSEEKLTEKEREESGGNGTRVSRPLCLPRAVRTLCDHSGLGAELSFQKGEELVVLGGVDQDWIRCRQGDKEGLVPISYTSLIM